MKRSGFTLIELLLVIGVIGILSGILFSGVLSVTGQANEKRIANNAKLLQAAIMEYRHDNNRWPIPENATATATKTHLKVPGTNSSRVGVKWNITYGQVDDKTRRLSGEGNDKVVEYLVDARVGGPNGAKKTYIDLRPFITATEDAADEWPTEDTEPAFDAYRNASKNEQTGRISRPIPLLYRRKFVKCPACGALQPQSGTLRNCRKGAGCSDSYKDQDGETVGHLFTRAELNDPNNTVDGAMPYVISFDLVNNTCTVSQF